MLRRAETPNGAPFIKVLCKLRAAHTVRIQDKKRAAQMSGSEVCSQGGVKQSGQEPLDVQKLDSLDSDLETLMSG